MSGIQMVVPDLDHHLDTQLGFKGGLNLNTRLNIVRFSNGILIPDHLSIGQTICQLEKFGQFQNQTGPVFRSQLLMLFDK